MLVFPLERGKEGFSTYVRSGEQVGIEKKNGPEIEMKVILDLRFIKNPDRLLDGGRS